MGSTIFWVVVVSAVVWYWVIWLAERKGVIHNHEEGDFCNDGCCTPELFKKRQAEIAAQLADGVPVGEVYKVAQPAEPVQSKDYVEVK